MSKTSWYGVRSVYKGMDRDSKDAPEKIVYEERVVLIAADSFDSAISKAEKEANKYESENALVYLGYVNAFQIDDETIKDGTEVYSLLRQSNLKEKEYLDAFFDTGNEYTQEK